MADDLKDEIKLSVDASGVETGVSKAKRSIADLGKTVDDTGKKGADSFNGIGQGAQRASGELDRATRNMVGSLQRQIAAAEAGGAATSAYQESIARLRGANLDVLRPYLNQLDEANRKTEEAKSKSEGLTSAFRGVSNQLVALASGFAAAFSFKKFIDETVSAQNEQAQLAAVLKSTGSAAGFSQQRLNDMAEQMSQTMKLSSGEINTAQTRLLSYSGVVGEQFPKAMQAAANMSTRMGIDIASAAEQIGKALDVPSKGLTALTKQGFRFTEAQADMIEKLEATGKTAEAQGIILQALESSYGGAATAARDTLGGALTALQNNIKSLMTGEGGSINEMRGGIESINTALSSPDTRAAFQTFLGWIATVSARAIEGAAKLLAFIQSADKLGAITGTDKLGKLKSEAADVTAHIARLTDQADRYQESINRGFNVDQNQRNLERTRQKLTELQSQAMAAKEKMKEFANSSVKAAVAPVLTPDLPVITPAASGPSKDSIKAANKELEEQAKLIAELSGLTGSFNADWNRLNAMYAAGKLSVDQLTEAQAKLLEKQPAIKAEMQDQAKAIEAANKAADREIDAISKQFDAAVKADEAITKARQSSAASAMQSVQNMQRENETRILAAALNISQAKAIELVNIKRLEEQRTILKGNGGHKEDLEAIEKEIAARKQLVEQIGQRDADQAVIDAAKKAADEWQKTADQINQSLTDALMRGFESGKDFAKNLRDTVVNMFKTLVLRPVISAIVNPVAMGLSGMLSGGAMAGQGGGMLGSAATSFGASALGSSIFGAAGAGGFGGLMGMGSFSAGMGAGFAGLMGEAGLMGSLSAGTTAIGAGNVLGGMGTIAGALGHILLGIGALASAFGLFAKTVKRGDTIIGTLGVEGGVHDADLMRKDGSLFSGPNWFLEDTGVSKMDELIQQQWDTSLKAVEKWSEALGLSTDKIAGFTTTLGTETLGDHGAIGIRLDNDGKPLSDQEISQKIALAIRTGNNELAQEIIGSWTETSREVIDKVRLPGSFWDNEQYKEETRTVIDRTYKPSEFARDGEQAVDTLQRLGTSIIAVNGAFEALNLAMFDASLAGADAASSFIDRFGTPENFAGSMNAYNQNFYTSGERREQAKKAMGKQFEEFGLDPIDLDDPQARMKYRALVEQNQAQMVQDQQNREAMRGALSTGLSGLDLSGADIDISSIVRSAMGDAAEVSAETTDKIKESFKSLQTGSISADEFTKAISDLVQSTDGAGKSAEETAAMLLQLSGDFANLTMAIPDLSGMAGDMASMISSQMLGTFEGENPGAALAQITADGIYNAIAGGFAQQITAIIVQGVVEPVVMAAMTGSSLSAAVSAESIAQMVAQANAVASAAAQIMSELRSSGALDAISAAVGSISIPVMRAVPAVQNYSSAVDRSASATTNAANDINKAIDSLVKTLDSAIKNLTGQVDDVAKWGYTQSQQYLRDALSVAQNSGALPDEDKIKDAISGISGGLSAAQFASKAEADFARLSAAGLMQQIKDIAEGKGAKPPTLTAPNTSTPPPVIYANNGASTDTARLQTLVIELKTEVQRLQTIAIEGNKNTKRTANAVNGQTDGMPMLVEVVA